MSNGFAGKQVVITGASRGIGFGVAKGFAAAGASLTLIADDPGTPAAAQSIGARGAVADITDPAAIDSALAQLGHIDVLVNNAGLERLTPVGEGGDEVEAVFRRIIEINVIGTQLVTRRALSKMTHGGAIVNTASIWGRVAEPLFGAYVASKHAVIGLTKASAGEVARQGIRVNAVCPGPVDTRMIHDLEKQIDPGNPGGVGARYQAALPSGRYSTVEEIANMVLFLCSDLAANTTGGQFVVDGGRTATGGAVTNQVTRT